MLALISIQQYSYEYATGRAGGTRSHAQPYEPGETGLWSDKTSKASTATRLRHLSLIEPRYSVTIIAI